MKSLLVALGVLAFAAPAWGQAAIDIGKITDAPQFQISSDVPLTAQLCRKRERSFRSRNLSPSQRRELREACLAQVKASDPKLAANE